MAGLHCSDCVFAEFSLNERTGMYQGTCSRGFTLADPRVHHEPEMYFVVREDGLVPVRDPFGREYLRTKNICDRFQPRKKE